MRRVSLMPIIIVSVLALSLNFIGAGQAQAAKHCLNVDIKYYINDIKNLKFTVTKNSVSEEGLKALMEGNHNNYWNLRLRNPQPPWDTRIEYEEYFKTPAYLDWKAKEIEIQLEMGKFLADWANNTQDVGLKGRLLKASKLSTIPLHKNQNHRILVANMTLRVQNVEKYGCLGTKK